MGTFSSEQEDPYLFLKELSLLFLETIKKRFKIKNFL
ncbi:hypothetical protein LCGC14_1141380 [marine sediment metagenome]|uniref:Uncharacterized protein n=1 Tax=marine sediment metagenome TaxID=412755 RepID=A0A0F9LY45_9ZZZZ